jgi:pimeloyl-ACP methyl ester carboxylesterase
MSAERMAPADVTIPEHIEHRIRTRDGRTVAAAEWGDPNGIPLFALHGTPGGRIGFWLDPTIYARHGLRRITVDRPGYGESTRQPGRIVAHIVPDIVAIADELGIGSFAVTGGSGGGPHALACAALLPDRVLRCLADVSIAPFGAEGLDFFADLASGNVDEFEAALRGEPDIRQLAEAEWAGVLARLDAGDNNILGDNYELSDADRAQMLKHAGRMAINLRAGLAGGVDGWVDDDIAFTKPWGFDLADIRVPVLLSYGRHDTLVPAAHGDWLAAHIPKARTRVNEDTGHMGNDEDAERDMAWLAGRS